MECVRTRKYSSVVLNTILLGMCVLSVGLLTLHKAPVFTQNTDEFRITQLLQNEDNETVVAFNIHGTYKRDDLVNLYANEQFIKSKLINDSKLVGTHEILIENISIDVLDNGENQIVAKIERGGVEVEETEPFHLTIQTTPDKPTITVLVNKDEDLIAIDVEGFFEENDIVKVFLNGNETTTRTVSSNEVFYRKVRIAGIEMRDLQVGENYFEASILRQEYESERSDKSEKIIVEEMQEQETAPAPQTVGAAQCVSYDSPQRIIAGIGDMRDGFGFSVSVKDGVFVAGTKTEKSYIYNKSAVGWLYPTTVFEQDLVKSKSTNKSVTVYNSDTVLVADPGSWYRERSAGAIYVYRRFGEIWTKYATIAPHGLVTYDEFGSSIALDSRTLVSGAMRADRSGAVYVYTRGTEGLWTNPIHLAPQDTAPEQEFGI